MSLVVIIILIELMELSLNWGKVFFLLLCDLALMCSYSNFDCSFYWEATPAIILTRAATANASNKPNKQNCFPSQVAH